MEKVSNKTMKWLEILDSVVAQPEFSQKPIIQGMKNLLLS